MLGSKIARLALYLLLGVGTTSSFLEAQSVPCFTDTMMQRGFHANPLLRNAFDANELSYEAFLASSPQRVAGSVRQIPVVVHVIQCSDLVQLPDGIVLTQLEVLNEDYRKIQGTPGFGNGVDTEYAFCLATIDPNGCPTTGINRITAPDWCHHQPQEEDSLKGLVQWDPHKYLNLWVPATIEFLSAANEVTGYATFPTQMSLSPQLDGVVINANYFGRNTPTTALRTATHEIGHWLGLFHTFQDGCQGNTVSTCTAQGDRICDTPQADVPNFGCPNVNTCIDSPVDPNDQVENYMDYSSTLCQHMFTQGQKARMDFFCNSIRAQIWSPGNLTATGCDGAVAACAPIPDFLADKVVVCLGQPVSFADQSGLAPSTWQWAFPGGTPSTSALQSPTVVYNVAGGYDVTLAVGNALGSNAVTKTAYIEVVEPTTALLQEGFEDSLSLPAHWLVTDNGGIHTWEQVSNASSQGQQSMKVKNFEARNAGESMSLHTRPFSMQHIVSGYLTFDHSYQQDSSLAPDELSVHISTDCGTTWELVWSRSGIPLATTTSLAQDIEWVPQIASDWQSDSILIDSFAGAPHVKVRFEVHSSGGQSIYLDNINMAVTLVNTMNSRDLPFEFTVAPNPFQDRVKIDYALPRASAMEVTVTDLTGKVLFQAFSGRQSAGSYSLPAIERKLQELPAGIYLLIGKSDAHPIARRLVKTH